MNDDFVLLKLHNINFNSEFQDYNLNFTSH